MLNNISRRSLFLVLSDAAAILVAYYLASFAWTGGRWEPYDRWPSLVFFTVNLLTFFYIFDLYYPFKRFKGLNTVIDVFLALLFGTLVFGLICFLTHRFILPRGLFIHFVGQIFAYAVAIRLLYNSIFKSRFLDKRTGILGVGSMAREVGDLIATTPNSGMEVVGYIAEEKDIEKQKIKGKEMLGHVGQIVSLLDWHNIRLLVLACDEKSKTSEFEIMRNLVGRNIQVISAIRLFENLSHSIPYKAIDARYVLSLESDVRGRHFLHLKRLLDVVFSALLLLLTLPLSLLAIFLLSFQGLDRIFFVQRRIGKGGKMFSMYKFRSMSVSERRGPSVTSLGKILRKFRIDELPQLLNVLKGDMSLIGPRPETVPLAKKSQRHIPYYDIVFTVRPGISGWAQVNLGHVADFKDYPKKFCFNVYYLKNISIELDLQIFLKTIRIILLGKGK
ncbi:MAG: exopolysaccharide biosynthesis polyprenyl glycosylphosphotransferase [Candidatus Omnitrophota bacterium]|jgi:exopolysaccharide biosynthesis polyprenyl glycosylphosphotransferase